MLRIYNKAGRLISVYGRLIPAKSSLDLRVPYDLNLRNMVRNKLISVKEIEEPIIGAVKPIVIEHSKEVNNTEDSSQKRNNSSSSKKKQEETTVN